MKPPAIRQMGLEGISPPVLGRTLFLTWGEARVVGRAHPPFVDLSAIGELAPDHCVLDWGPNGAQLYALAPEGQTLHNGAPASTAILADGDLLQLGGLRFRVHLRPSPPGRAEQVASPLLGMLHRELTAGPLYLLLDAAAADGLAAQLRALDAPVASLYRGTAEENLEEVAPYLVDVSHHPEAAEALVVAAWGKRQLALMRPSLGFDQVRRQLRRFLFVVDDQDRKLYFRFSDPVILQRFLLASSPEENALFLREIDEILVECDADPSRLLRLGHGASSRWEPLCSA